MTQQQLSFDGEQFLNLVEHDGELARTLVGLFAQEHQRIISELESAIQSKSYKQIEQLGHKIKGTLRNFFAEDASEVAQRIEEGGRIQNIVQASLAVNELKPLVHRVMRDLTEFCKTL